MAILSKIQSFVPSDAATSDVADIKKVVEAIPELFWVPPAHIYKLWCNFSREQCASWLIVGPETVQQFKEWLE